METTLRGAAGARVVLYDGPTFPTVACEGTGDHVDAAEGILLYRPLVPRRGQLVAVGLLQATSLSIPIVAGRIGVDIGVVLPDTYAALVAAGLLSVIAFPLLALPRLAEPARPDTDHSAGPPDDSQGQ